MDDTTFGNPGHTTNLSDPSGIWPDVLTRISRISRSLTGVSTGTEEDFMALGRSLMEGNGAGRNMEEKALEIVAVTRGDMEKNALASMKVLIGESLSRFRTSSGSIENQFVSVKNVLVRLGELQAKNEDINGLAKYLRAVALNIFIETSRSSVLSENFSIIAGEIKQLSENILNISKTVSATLDDAKKRFTALYADTQAGISELAQVSHDTDQAVQLAVNTTDKVVSLAEKTAETAADMGKDIAGHVGKIVMALQFHDALRQRLEHIVTCLSDIPSFADPHEGPARDSLSMAHAMVSLMGDHLGHMMAEIDDIHDQCSVAFAAIERCIESIAEDVARLAGGETGAARSGEDAGRHLLSSILSLGSLRNRGIKMIEQMSAIYTMSMETTSTLTGLTGKIHDISRDAHIKGINAIIAASHLGDEGRTLSVLAGEMKKLADLADIFVKDVETIIHHVVSELETPRQNDESGDELDKRLDDSLFTIVAMVDAMKSKTADLHQTMETMDAIRLAVKKELPVIPSMGRDLAGQKKNLNDVLALLAPYADKRGKERLAERGIIERYTMEKERLIHRSSVSDDQDAVSDIKINPDESQDLGDNIELF